MSRSEDRTGHNEQAQKLSELPQDDKVVSNRGISGSVTETLVGDDNGEVLSHGGYLANAELRAGRETLISSGRLLGV